MNFKMLAQQVEGRGLQIPVKHEQAHSLPFPGVLHRNIVLGPGGSSVVVFLGWDPS